jgi:hypothetical protein
VLHLEQDTHQVASVFLKLERCSGTLTWCRPPWKDPRRGLGFGIETGSGSNINNVGAGSSAYNLDSVETTVSPGLRLKYTNRSGESLAYQVRKTSFLFVPGYIYKCLYRDHIYRTFFFSKNSIKNLNFSEKI